MNRPFSRETEDELLRAAEAHPGQGLVLGADGIARPATTAPTEAWAWPKARLVVASTRSQYIAKLLASIADLALDLDVLEAGGAISGLFDEYGAPSITAESTKAEIRRRMSMISDALADQPASVA